MGRFDNAYSRAVAAVKILLPLLALGVLSTLFFFSRPSQQGEPLPFPDVAVLNLAREQRLGAPTFSGVTDSGTRVTLSAESLRPDPDRQSLIHTSAPSARLSTPDGVDYAIAADRGEIDQQRNVTAFHDGVSIETSSGYVLYTPAIEIAADLSWLRAPSDVRVTGQLGFLTSGGMEIVQDPEKSTDARLVFTGGVRLLYNPQS